MEAEYKRDDPNEGPCVFYPKRNQALLTSLSEHIAQGWVVVEPIVTKFPWPLDTVALVCLVKGWH